MKRSRLVLVWVAALVTLGSGLVNLFSVIGPSLPERRAILRELFPLEFLHLSRFLTLLIGFALVISSVNIYKRKRRALQLVVLLACLSVVFHLTKGLDYEEATFSVVLVGLLVLERRHFTVRSSVPNLQHGFMRLGAALVVAFAYGVAGFWFLDPREFGINFNIVESIRLTWSFLTFAGDPRIIPHTHYAAWFLDSLYVISATAIGYSLFAVFRPAVYRFAMLPHERARAAELVSRHGRSAQDFFKHWPDKSFYFSPSENCFVAYRVGASFAVALGDPVGPAEEIEPTARGFAEFCQENDWRVAFYQTLPDFLETYRRLGFRKLKVGDDAIVDLLKFNLDGKAMKKVRYYCNQMEKAGIRVGSYEPPVPEGILAQCADVSDDWLQIPGRRERGFTLGCFQTDYVRSTPAITAEDAAGKVLAFMNLVPSFCPKEATIDLMRHRRDAPNGVMDFLFVRLFERCKGKGFERFNLGMAPMAGFQEREDAAIEERAIHTFFQQLNFLFSFSGIRQYKAKFATFWEPRYAVYRSPLDLPRLARALARISQLSEQELEERVA